MRQWLRTHPFLLLGVGSLFLFLLLLAVDLPSGSLRLRMLVALWQVAGIGPHAASNLLARYAPGLPGAVDAALVVILGLLPYLGADAVLARARSRRRRPNDA